MNGGGSTVRRLFVGVWPPPPVVEALTALPRADHPRVRWTTPDQWHLTLRFLGELDPSVARGVLADVGHPPVEVALGPRVERWGSSLAVIPARGLEGLARAVRRVTSGLVPDEGERPFRGHLTLARARGRARLPADVVGREIGVSFVVDEVTLVASALEPGGARYEVLERHRLS